MYNIYYIKSTHKYCLNLLIFIKSVALDKIIFLLFLLNYYIIILMI